MLRLRRWVNDPRIEITLSILTPFLAYWPPERLGGSGVLATVTSRALHQLERHTADQRRDSAPGHLLLGLLHLPDRRHGVPHHRSAGAHVDSPASGDYSMSELAVSAAVVSAVVIMARFVWMYPATYLPRWLFPAIERRDPSPPWQWPFALAFTGVRGIVSLAAALAIPLATANGQPFPDRDLILFLTFAVILVTLVGQGLMLPSVIRALGLAHAGRRERHTDRAEEYEARRQAIEAATERLDQLGRNAISRRTSFSRSAPSTATGSRTSSTQ